MGPFRFLTRPISSLPAPWIGALAVIGVLAVVAAGVGAYRTYDFVQHDNAFCLNCHLMEEPYERFAQSAHRDLGCKSCHNPTLAARTQMALTQVVEQPETLSVHAQVENEKCADCHINGDPERWRIVAATAGHRVHFESTDSVLQGLKCVQCHSTSLHEFAPTDRTCGQSGCHAETRIQLGRMGQFTIHCTTCHGFTDPVAGDTAAVQAALQPEADQCLGCHAMRQLIDLPDDEPHGGVCASCHNPHEQTTPEQAEQTCATAACHTDPESLTPMHVGLPEGTLESCVSCHAAHTFRVDGNDCLACHQDVLGAGAGGGRVAGARLPAGHPDVSDVPGARRGRLEIPAVFAALRSPGLALAAAPTAGPVRPATRPAAPPPQARRAFPDSVFRHATHRDLGCSQCHSSQRAHGEVTVQPLADCRQCHHVGRVAEDCSRCHQASGTPTRLFRATRTLDLSVGGRPRRALPFEHEPHAQADCAACHAGGANRSAAQTDCSACHQDHHRPDSPCMQCHVQAPARVHPVAQVHVGCGGSGCHTEVPVPGVPRTRAFCLTCHQDLTEHRPEQSCEACHSLPSPRAAPG